jgi:DNA polymerase I-like protein with 3'-5' exonuclease and polymerase domains
LYAEADYSGLELHTWAQSCLNALGESELAKALNAGIDPHLVLAASMLDVSYAETLARYKAGDEKVAGTQGARQFAKIGNFGFQGGMSAETFRGWARVQYKVNFSEEQANHIRSSWYQTWPESEPYFRWIKAQCEQGGGYATITQFKSNRVRGLITFTIAANTFFQGLGADATKDVLFALQRECYVEKWSPLYGCRMVNYVHDSYALEVPEDLEAANAAVKRLVEVMIEVATRWLPDVPPRVEATLSKHWSKKAKAVRNEQGLLIPWEWTQ